MAVCRFCMEEAEAEELIAPCQCIGTQKYVHAACLHRWQAISLRNRLKCPVCQHSYRDEFIISAYAGARQSIPRSRLDRVTTWLVHNFLWTTGVGLLGGAVWQRQNYLLIAMVLAVILVWSVFRFLPFWWAVVVDETGTPSWQLIRYGQPLEGLGVGTLLVATHQIDAGIFRRSVLVITEHDQHTGSLGYILNSPFDVNSDSEIVQLSQHALQLPVHAAITHGRGGPVAMGEWIAFHSFADVSGARPLGHGHFVGGELTDIRRFALEHIEHPQLPANEHPGAQLQLQVVHGYAAWAAGQLEGEIRAGAWVWRAGAAHDFILDSDHATMWSRAFQVCLPRRD
ncbi:hypothetical protein AB1Y20_020469 [Prymnesium parvum]|uniref:RING-CH-type domain-containing protein n=1 Tax=Prymnesium parvum TaxID=97485 RepID=A0AB34JY41_PRYPA